MNLKSYLKIFHSLSNKGKDFKRLPNKGMTNHLSFWLSLLSLSSGQTLSEFVFLTFCWSSCNSIYRAFFHMSNSSYWGFCWSSHHMAKPSYVRFYHLFLNRCYVYILSNTLIYNLIFSYMFFDTCWHMLCIGYALVTFLVPYSPTPSTIKHC